MPLVETDKAHWEMVTAKIDNQPKHMPVLPVLAANIDWLDSQDTMH